LKKLSICPLGKAWVNCLKSLKKPSIYPLGITPSAPSVQFNEWTRWLSERGELGDAETVATQVAEMTLDEELEDFREFNEH